MKDQKYLDWIKVKRDFLNIKEVERELNMPTDTLRHWLAERRPLAAHWQGPLVKWVKEFKK